MDMMKLQQNAQGRVGKFCKQYLDAHLRLTSRRVARVLRPSTTYTIADIVSHHLSCYKSYQGLADKLTSWLKAKRFPRQLTTFYVAKTICVFVPEEYHQTAL